MKFNLCIDCKFCLRSIVALVFLCCLVGCRGDGETSILNGYQIVYISKDDVLIDNRDAQNRRYIVLEARIDNYLVVGNTIRVARTPVETFINERGNADYRMLPRCEYWEIDTKQDMLKKTDKLPGLSCN